MPTLEVNSEPRPLAGGGAASLVHVRGSVDTATLGRLDETLTEVVAGQQPLVVLDLSELDYINSRGMANLVKHHDAAAEANGRLVLAAMPAKIYATFETMGFDATFVFEDDVEGALEALAAAHSAPAASASFPFGFACDACVATLTAGEPGKYRCPRCQAPFEVTGEGKVLFFPARDAHSVEMSFPCRASYVETARAAAASVARDVELSAIPTELLDRTIDETIGLFVGKADEAGGTLRLYIAADNREFTVAFIITDESLLITDDDRQDLTFRALTGIVDELDLIPVEPTGQILKLVKRF